MTEKGFTLVELVISMTLIAIAIVGTLLAINTAVLFSGDPMLNYQAVAIAESYLEEILGKNFPVFPCPAPPAPGGRASFNNICQYDGLQETPTSQQNQAISPLLSAYTVNVSVDSTTAVLGNPSLVPGTQVVRVDVSISHHNMPTMTYSGYRTNY